MTTTAAELSLSISRTLPHPAEKIFDAWLDPAMLAKFMTPGPTVTVPVAEADPREGGRFKIIMRPAEGDDLPHTGTYMRIDRPNQLVFTWESPFSTLEGSTVTLDLVEHDGQTELTLTHIRFENEEMRGNHEGGWTSILTALEAKLAS